MKISTILDQIDIGSMALPEFQRGYVWNRDQVRKLMSSLYRKHPVGSLLVWVTKTEGADARGDGQLTPGSVKLILDGQQRITSLYGIIRGHEPRFFDGDRKAFEGLYFSLEDETFEFYAPLKMRDNPHWISVTDLMKTGAGEAISKIAVNPEMSANLTQYITRLNAIDSIKQVELHIDEVTGEDKTIDVVVDIFNNVNSGGTKLSKGDLALAKICAEWPDARNAMKLRLAKWKAAGFGNLKLEWLMRCINAIITGEALFSHLSDVEVETFKSGLTKAEKSIDFLLNLVSSRLGLDHDRVLGSRYSFPLLARYVDERGGRLNDPRERDKLLYWYIHTFLWGRYAGSTESILSQDLRALRSTAPLDQLIGLLSQNRGDLRIRENDFLGWSMGARFYPLLYMMTRTGHARDWNTGIKLSGHLLGRLSGLEVHHIFPKDLLYKSDYARSDVNALANFTFLTKETNLLVTNRNPSEYLEEFDARNPGVLESHWIPMDRNLWQMENYEDFLAVRRELLANAANQFLDGLMAGEIPECPPRESVLDREVVEIGGGVSSEGEEDFIIDCNQWTVDQGLPEGEFLFELLDSETNEVKAVIDLAWPYGLQEGYSSPVALLIDEDKETEEAVNSAGYRFFTDFEDFKHYVLSEIKAELPVLSEPIAASEPPLASPQSNRPRASSREFLQRHFPELKMYPTRTSRRWENEENPNYWDNWWVSFNFADIEKNDYIVVAGAQDDTNTDFKVFKIPTRYLLENKDKISVSGNRVVNLYLDFVNFVDLRNPARLPFGQFALN